MGALPWRVEVEVGVVVSVDWGHLRARRVDLGPERIAVAGACFTMADVDAHTIDI